MTNQTTGIWETVKRRITLVRRSRDYTNYISEDLIDDDTQDIQGFEESDDIFE